MPDTGAPWFIPYVESTDLVSDWPTDSLALANAIVAALEDIPVTQKKIEAFTGSGTWTVPAGVTYAIAHMRGGGGGAGNTNTGSDGADSSVAFASGTVVAPGNRRSVAPGTGGSNPIAGAANSSQNAVVIATAAAGPSTSGAVAGYTVAGAAVTPAASITVTVGAGGAAGTAGAAGGSGYVYIEYYAD